MLSKNDFIFDYEGKKKVRDFVNSMFNFATISVINKATRITQHCATAIDYIHINSVLNTKTQTGIIKTDISANFPIFFVTK